MISKEMRRNAVLVVAVGLMALASACSSAPGAAPGDGATVSDDEGVRDIEAFNVARLEFPGGTTVSFYEPAPGQLLLGERGNYPNQPILQPADYDSLVEPGSAEKIYSRLAPGREIPASLRAAVERERQRPTLDEPEEPLLVETQTVSPQQDLAPTPRRTEGDVARVSQAVTIDENADDSQCPWSYFQPNFCFLCLTGSCGRFSTQWGHITGDSTIRYKTTLMKLGMCVYRGTVRYVFRLHGKVLADATLTPNQYITWGKNNGSHDYTASNTVTQADGDGYHHCAEAE